MKNNKTVVYDTTRVKELINIEIISSSKVYKRSQDLSAPNERCWVNSLEKIPYTPNGKRADTTDPLTWSTYEEVNSVKDNFDGIGIVFTGMLLGIDIDHCIIDGKITPEIQQFIEKTKTYTEISPSGTGLHMYLKLTVPLHLERNKGPRVEGGSYEFYVEGRYFRVSENEWVSSYPVRTVTPKEALEIIKLSGYPWKKENTLIANDEELLQKMFTSKNGARIRSLYEGDISDHNNDYSSADASLCAHLAYWTNGDTDRITSLWLDSPLGARNKTQDRKDYQERTVSFAINSFLDSKTATSPVNGSEDFKRDLTKNRAEAIYKIAKHLVEKYHIKTIGDKVRDTYIYENGIYVLGLNFLKAEIQKLLEELASPTVKKNIIDMVQDLTLSDRKDFTVDNNLINLNNGIFDLKSKKIIQHSHVYPFFTKIPVDYDPAATCPNIDAFFRSILPEEHVKVVLEWFGYCLYRRYFIKKAIIFVGEKDTGKSTAITLHSRFIGKGNTSGVSLQTLSSDKFSSSQLYNKYINIYDDLSFKDINDNGLFKIVTGGGIITGEKKFGEQFQFENHSKLTFACNKIPDVKDTNDDAYFSRWIIIPFTAEITKVDKFLTDKITTKEELSGLLNLAIAGLCTILTKENFSYNKSPEEIKREMLLSGSMVANFINDCLEKEDGSWISKDEMYEVCARYAHLNKLPVIDKQSLGKRIPRHSGYIIDGTKKVEGKQVQGWRNVKIKTK